MLVIPKRIGRSFGAKGRAKESDGRMNRVATEDAESRNDKVRPPVEFRLDKGEERSKRVQAHMNTSKGNIVIDLLPEESPVTVASFVNLAQRGYYDGISFHRVIGDFMIQGGDPTGTGRGGPGYQFEDEFGSGRKFDRSGILAMANAGPGTNGSQFFITHVPTPHLNQKHTIFGLVSEGQDVVNSISQGDVIESLQIKGDTSELIANHKDRIEEWNEILESR